jgi:hypothetical protein
MADENDDVLRRSLRAVDRNRNWMMIGIVMTAVLLVFAFGEASQAVRTGSTPLLLHAIMLILGVWTTMMAFVVVIQITLMTKRILRAIELASRK